MLYREIITVCSEIHTKHINTYTYTYFVQWPTNVHNYLTNDHNSYMFRHIVSSSDRCCRAVWRIAFCLLERIVGWVQKYGEWGIREFPRLKKLSLYSYIFFRHPVSMTLFIIVNSFYSLCSIGHPWRAYRRCDLHLFPWPHSMIFLFILFHPLLSFALLCMGVKLGRRHWGRNVGWGC